MPARDDSPGPAPERLSDHLARWLRGDDTSLGGLIDLFGPKSFAVMFVVLMAVPALPLPTGGATHVFEILVALGAVQLILGRDEIWIPQRWRDLNVGGQDGNSRFIRALLWVIRTLERISRPRMDALFGRRLSTAVFGVLVLCGTVGAFLAPPFTGLDTVPSLGVVVLALGVLLEDALIALIGLVLGVVGIALEIFLAAALVNLASNAI
jgi:hypothetical protein